MDLANGRADYVPITARPSFEWPDGKRLAIWFSINIESFIYGVEEGVQWTQGLLAPDTTNWAWREYGNRVGFWRLLSLCTEESIPISAIVNTRVAEYAPELADALRQARCDIVAHGRTNSEAQNRLAEPAERALIDETTSLLTKTYGSRPLGWMSPGINGSAVTTDLLQEAGYTYMLDWPMDDQPIWLRTRTDGRLLTVPYPTELNDISVLVSHHGLAREFTDSLIDNFDEMLEQSESQALVFGISTHTFLSGQPHRLRQLRRALRYMQERSADVWWTTSGEIAKYFASLDLQQK